MPTKTLKAGSYSALVIARKEAGSKLTAMNKVFKQAYSEKSQVKVAKSAEKKPK